MTYPLIQVVIPVYNEGGALYGNIRAISDILRTELIPHSFILVDDGSTDNTRGEIVRLKDDGIPLSALRFSRNFGKEAAICAGLEAVTEEYCVVMDSDLQHPPSAISEMLTLLIEGGYDMIEGVKSDRGDESFISKLLAGAFYGLFYRFSGTDLRNSSDFKLISSGVLRAWKELGDANTFFRGMIEWVGFKKARHYFKTAPRSGGVSKFSFFRLAVLGVDAITSFSVTPLHLTTFFGIAFFISAIILAAQTLYNKLTGTALTGFTTVILLQLLIGSLILISLGIIGIYISKIYQEVKGRPRYIISERI